MRITKLTLDAELKPKVLIEEHLGKLADVRAYFNNFNSIEMTIPLRSALIEPRIVESEHVNGAQFRISVIYKMGANIYPGLIERDTNVVYLLGGLQEPKRQRVHIENLLHLNPMQYSRDFARRKGQIPGYMAQRLTDDGVCSETTLHAEIPGFIGHPTDFQDILGLVYDSVGYPKRTERGWTTYHNGEQAGTDIPKIFATKTWHKLLDKHIEDDLMLMYDKLINEFQARHAYDVADPDHDKVRELLKGSTIEKPRKWGPHFHVMCREYVLTDKDKVETMVFDYDPKISEE